MGCGDDDHVCTCGNKMLFVCVSCGKKESIKTGETGYRALAHIIGQATEKGWVDYEDVLINGELCRGCSEFIDGTDEDTDSNETIVLGED